jgi:hypothetical protein
MCDANDCVNMFLFISRSPQKGGGSCAESKVVSDKYVAIFYIECDSELTNIGDFLVAKC